MVIVIVLDIYMLCCRHRFRCLCFAPSPQRIAYEEVLSTMVASLGDQPQDVLRGAADEVLLWLKVR